MVSCVVYKSTVVYISDVHFVKVNSSSPIGSVVDAGTVVHVNFLNLENVDCTTLRSSMVIEITTVTVCTVVGECGISKFKFKAICKSCIGCNVYSSTVTVGSVVAVESGIIYVECTS